MSSSGHRANGRLTDSQDRTDSGMDRRDFVRTAGGILVSSSLAPYLAGCKSIAPKGTGKGTISVMIDGFPTGATNAGTIAAVGTSGANAGQTIDVPLPAPSAGTSKGSAPADVGVYDVTYQPPSNTMLTTGEQATQAGVKVGESATTPLTWSLAAPTANAGTLGVSVTGFDAGATDPGTVTAVGTAGAASGQKITVSLPVPNAGSSSTQASVPTGTYDVTYTPPSGANLATGQQATHAGVTISSGQTSSEEWQLQTTITSSPGGILFHSDWATATGTSNAALDDTNKVQPWNTAPLTAANPSVIAAAAYFTAGFANCFKAPVINGGSGGKAASVHDKNVWAAPTAGSDLFYRAYLYADWPTAETSLAFGGHHPWESGPGSVNWSFKFGHTQGSDNLVLYFATSTAHDLARIHTPLTFRTEYRIELHAHILSATSYTAEIQIYDASGNLIRQTSDFDMVNQSGLTLDQVVLAASSYSQWQLMAIGTNGVGNFNATQNDANLWGGVCVRNDTWCGPYANGV